MYRKYHLSNFLLKYIRVFLKKKNGKVNNFMYICLFSKTVKFNLL